MPWLVSYEYMTTRPVQGHWYENFDPTPAIDIWDKHPLEELADRIIKRSQGVGENRESRGPDVITKIYSMLEFSDEYSGTLPPEILGAFT